MKRYLIGWVLFALIHYKAQAQTQFGVTASGFINQVRIDPIGTPGFQFFGIGGINDRVGFSLGGFAQANLRPWLVTRVELNYVNTGYRSREPREDKLTGIYTTNYLQFTPMLGLRVKRGFTLMTGPSLNLHIGSSARQTFALSTTQPVSYTILDEWTHTRGLLNSPPDQDRLSGVTERFVLGWQVQLAYTHQRFSAHVNRQWHLNPMGNWMIFRSAPNLGINNFYYSSWQVGLSYALLQRTSKRLPNQP